MNPKAGDHIILVTESAFDHAVYGTPLTPEPFSRGEHWGHGDPLQTAGNAAAVEIASYSHGSSVGAEFEISKNLTSFRWKRRKRHEMSDMERQLARERLQAGRNARRLSLVS